MLPTGAATESTLAAVKTDLDQFQFDGSGNLKVNVELETPETVTVIQPTGTNLHTVVDSGTVAVSNFPATQPVSGPLTDAQLRASPVPVSGTVTANLGTIADVATQTTLAEVEEDLDQLTFSSTRLLVDGSGVTQPISAASLPLPSGAATAALQTQPGVDIGDVTVNNGAGASAVNVQDGGNSLTVDGTVTTTFPSSTTATLTNVSSSVTNVTLLSSNASRKMATIFNDSTTNLFVKFGATASATSFTVKIALGGYYELPIPVYTGQIDGIWDVANGSARITEY